MMPHEDSAVRTTLTLEDDVAAAIQALVRERGDSFKAVVNDLLRRGLVEASTNDSTPYRIEPVSLGQPRYADLDDIGEILLAAEGEDHR